MCAIAVWTRCISCRLRKVSEGNDPIHGQLPRPLSVDVCFQKQAARDVENRSARILPVVEILDAGVGGATEAIELRIRLDRLKEYHGRVQCQRVLQLLRLMN